MLTAVDTIAPCQQAHTQDKRLTNQKEPPVSLTDDAGQAERTHLAAAQPAVESEVYRSFDHAALFGASYPSFC
jgi:hypothetical protein